MKFCDGIFHWDQTSNFWRVWHDLIELVLISYEYFGFSVKISLEYDPQFPLNNMSKTREREKWDEWMRREFRTQHRRIRPQISEVAVVVCNSRAKQLRGNLVVVCIICLSCILLCQNQLKSSVCAGGLC